MLNITALNVSYGSHRVLKGISMEVESKTIHGLVGLNGSGKTTLLNTLYGIKKADSGNIKIASSSMGNLHIGYLETQNYFYPRITGMEYLRLISCRNEGFEIDRWNELFELPLSQLIDEYSTGMKKKLAMFGVISLNKPILMLDEPFNGIDLETVYKLKSLLLKLRDQGVTILITSHILESLTNLCDCISYLNRGIIDFTLGREEFDSLENQIFSLHKQKIESQLNGLLNNHGH
jgi:ABC-2 type transport system ATP-binding protein